MGSCKAICPPGSTPECYKGEEFGKCHKKCMYTSAEEEKGDQCSKYAKWGKEAIQGCHACANYYPGRADECMMCGGQCKNICPAGSSHDCYKRDEFVTCHKKCMHTGKAAAIPREFEQKKINEDDVKCSKYEKWGEVAVRGCQGCAKWYPGRVDGCMQCGDRCKAICPPGSTPECYKGEEFGKCHKKCMYTSAEEEKGDQCSKYAKWGKEATHGCHECAKYYPGRADECMKCGAPCENICPAGSSFDCYKGDEFVTCHKTCMHTGAEEQSTVRKDNFLI